MNRLEAAQRLGIPEHLVLTVREHAAGHLADLRDGRTMLVAETVARVYVPDVDDPVQLVGETGPELFTVGDKPAEIVAKPKATAKKAPRGGSNR